MALTMRATMQQRTDVLGVGLRSRVAAFQAEVRAARTAAAKTATATSLANINRIRPVAPPRRGRNSVGLDRVLRWRPVGTGDQEAGVGLNLAQLNSEAPYWIIQEIGTGQRATIHVGGSSNPVGRPTAGASYVRTVRSQVGRRISSGLVFASGPRGVWTRPGAAEGQQLYLRRQVTGVPATRNRSQAGIIIHKEIVGQHFVQRGGQAGFREYRSGVLAAARSQFKKR